MSVLQQYSNPVLKGFHPDPTICRVNDDYFLAVSSFGYFPGVPLYHSKNLVDWEPIGHCLTRKSQLLLDKVPPHTGGIYAPTLRYHKGLFYMVTTHVSHKGHFYVTTDDPYGKWSDPVWIPKTHQGGIDPDLFWDEDGTCYFTAAIHQACWKSSICQFKLDPSSGKALSPLQDIWHGSGWRGTEGPHLYERNGYYYLLTAEGGTEYSHRICVVRSRSPQGPWEICPRNPVLTHSGVASDIQCTGHGDLIEAADGSWWIVFLAVRPSYNPLSHHLGRETFLAPVHWTKDDWFEIANGKPVSARMEAVIPGVTSPPSKQGSKSSSFAASHDWIFINNPIPKSLSVDESKGSICLWGTPENLASGSALAFMGKRQTDFNFKLSVDLAFEPEEEGEEAGIAVYMAPDFFYTLSVHYEHKCAWIQLRKRLGDLDQVVFEKITEYVYFHLMIDADRDAYHFSFVEGKLENQSIAGSGLCRMLASEVAGGYTGVILGLFASGNGAHAKHPADFSNFHYSPLDVAGIDNKQ